MRMLVAASVPVARIRRRDRNRYLSFIDLSLGAAHEMIQGSTDSAYARLLHLAGVAGIDLDLDGGIRRRARELAPCIAIIALHAREGQSQFRGISEQAVRNGCDTNCSGDRFETDRSGSRRLRNNLVNNDGTL